MDDETRMARLLAFAQIGLAAFIFVLFAAVLFALLFMTASLPDGVLDLLKLLLAQLVAVLIMQANYFFQRQRPRTITDRRPPGPESSER